MDNKSIIFRVFPNIWYYILYPAHSLQNKHSLNSYNHRMHLSPGYYTSRDHNALQSAVIERSSSNISHTVRYREMGQTLAKTECGLSNSSHTITNHYIRQPRALPKQHELKYSHTAGDLYTRHTFTSIKCTRSNRSHTVRDLYILQTVAITERGLSNRSHTVRDRYTCQFVTRTKSISRDSSHTVCDAVVSGGTGNSDIPGYIITGTNTSPHFYRSCRAFFGKNCELKNTIFIFQKSLPYSALGLRRAEHHQGSGQAKNS